MIDKNSFYLYVNKVIDLSIIARFVLLYFYWITYNKKSSKNRRQSYDSFAINLLKMSYLYLQLEGLILIIFV